MIKESTQKHSDPFINKYLIKLELCHNDRERATIIDKIYEDGFEDGVNSEE